VSTGSAKGPAEYRSNHPSQVGYGILANPSNESSVTRATVRPDVTGLLVRNIGDRHKVKREIDKLSRDIDPHSGRQRKVRENTVDRLKCG
jgi:hypothetical protein